MKNKPNSVYDGFCHRPYNEETDGWIMEQPKESEYPIVSMARDIISMYNEICELRRENWRLRTWNEQMESSFLGIRHDKETKE